MAPWARIEPEEVGGETLWFVWHSYGYTSSGDDQDGNGPFRSRDEAAAAAEKLRTDWNARRTTR